jgi:transitional endoplasmic reticulum ATPase
MSQDEFINISNGPHLGTSAWTVSGEFFENSRGKRIFTEGLIVDSIRNHHSKYHLTYSSAAMCDLIAFADSRGDTNYQLRNPSESLLERNFMPPARRYNDDTGGAFSERISFGCYDYVFQGNPFLVYVVEGRDGLQVWTRNNFILVAPSNENNDMSAEEIANAQRNTDQLLEASTKWGQELHDEVLVFDMGYWQKNKELWQNVQKSNWEDVILDEERKEAIINDVIGFFNGEDRYQEFGVPWKACDPLIS